MNERIQQFGGTLSVESASGNGVTIAVQLPLSRVTVAG
jgi:signal transduction histidine kinase